MPTLRPRKRASAFSSSAPSASPATTTEPASGRSRPAMTISSVDLPEPDGPTIPIASPRPILRSMPLRMWTRAAPRPSDRLTPASATAAPFARPEVLFMRWIRRSLWLFPRGRCARLGSYGSSIVLIQSFVLVAAFTIAAGEMRPTVVKAADRPVKIVALGDSLTAGYNLPASAAFPVKLEKALKAKGHAVEIANAGVSGDTASGGLARLDWSVPEGTDAVIVELGANDALRGIAPELTRAALQEILRRLNERRITVLLAGMRAPPNMGIDYVRAFDAIFPELAAANDVILYPFFLDGVAADRVLNQPDGLHPT